MALPEGIISFFNLLACLGAGRGMKAAVPLQALLLLILLPCLAGVAQASVSVSAYVAVGEVSVQIELAGLNATIYDLARTHAGAFNETTVPEAIRAYLADKGLEGIYYRDASISFNDTAKSISISFTLVGKGLMDFRYNKTDMSRIYELRADWRKVDVPVRDGGELLFKINFSSYFSKPLQEWEEGECEVAPGDVRPCLSLNSTVEDRLFNTSSWAFWCFILPRGAEFLWAKGDTLSFRMPPEPLDLFIASPFWPFLAIVVIVGVAVAYRRMAIKLVKPEAGGA